LTAPSPEHAANEARAQLVSGDEQAAPLELALVASQAVHVRVVADGAMVNDGDVSVGQGLHFSSLEKFEVSAAPASALLLQLNGHTVMPAGTLGSSGTILLTSKDLRPTTGGSTRP
jgi:hypothetical protein